VDRFDVKRMRSSTASARNRPVISILALVVSLLTVGVPTNAQNSFNSEGLLPAIRRAATSIPGDLPRSLHVLIFDRDHAPGNVLVENGSSEMVTIAYPVFQIVYPRGWIMVDAGQDRKLMEASGASAAALKEFSDERYSKVQLALRDARMIVLTHEHDDHAGGVIRSPYLDQIEPKTLMTRAQLRNLLDHANPPRLGLSAKLEPERAAHYMVVDYDRLLPIAPGVVLIKAAGHTPGSQMVYIHLKSGQEIILAGDVAWHMSGIQNRHQKSADVSKSIDEDRKAIQDQLDWLHNLASQQVTVVVSHDDAQLSDLVKRGILKEDVDLKQP
jgi:glyoxylase-like metal-dependent hydrolase (beta-lactamase superfamily II)